MILTSQQKDALTELINIGFGRAASALSILVGQRVVIEVPSVELFPISRLREALHQLANNEITSVHQVFSGKISGAAMLLMDTSSSAALVDLLNGGPGRREDMDERDRETIEETGNILLNAFTGSFGNLLQVHISFSVPQVRYASLENMMHSLTIDQQELEFALLVQVNFAVTGGEVSGYVVIVMGVQSMEALIESMRFSGFID